MPSLLDTFTGSAQKRYATDAYNRSTAALQGGYDDASKTIKDYYSQGQGYLEPYAQQGRQASNLYGNFLGLNGADQQRRSLQDYATADPFRAFNEDNMSRALSRRYNAMGMLDSGNARLGMSRAMLERGSTDYENYMNRLAAMQGQGLGIAGTQAGMATQTGNTLGGMRYGLGQTQAGNEINYGNALTQAASILPNNLIKLGGLALQGASLGMGGSLGGIAARGMGQSMANGGGANDLRQWGYM